jgi:hypothetical protein
MDDEVLEGYILPTVPSEGAASDSELLSSDIRQTQDPDLVNGNDNLTNIAFDAEQIEENAVGQLELSGRLERIWDALRRHRVAVAVGALVAGGVVAGLVADSNGALQAAKECGLWVGVGMSLGEVVFNIGALMCARAIGRDITWNHPMQIPGQIHAVIKELPEKAKNNPEFNIGLAVNTVGAVAEAVIPTFAIVTHLPPEAWSTSAVFLGDLAATVTARYAIWRGVHAPSKT